MIVSPETLNRIRRGQIKDKDLGSRPPLKNAYGFLGTTEVIKTHFKIDVQNALKDANLGSQAPNVTLIDLKSKKEVKLFDFMKKDRPLILNFGSCT